MVGPLFLLLATGLTPTTVLAASASVNTQKDPIVVYIVLFLLVVSVAAGLFFASPWRRKLFRENVEPPQLAPQAQPQRHDVQPPYASPVQPAVPGPSTPSQQPYAPPQPALERPDPGGPAWSTSIPQPDHNWEPTRR
jgi:hypothetical protein